MMTNMGIVHRDLFALPSVTRKKGHENYNDSLLPSNNSLLTIYIFLADISLIDKCGSKNNFNMLVNRDTFSS